MGPDDGKPDSRIQTPLPKSKAGGAHWSRPCTRRLWDSLLFETESGFETARVVSQGPVGFRAWAESSLRGLKNSRLKAQGSRLKAQGSRLKAQGSRLKAQGSRLKAQGTRLKAQGSRLKAQGSRHKAQGSRILYMCPSGLSDTRGPSLKHAKLMAK